MRCCTRMGGMADGDMERLLRGARAVRILNDGWAVRSYQAPENANVVSCSFHQ